jgi:hypothetical protein
VPDQPAMSPRTKVLIGVVFGVLVLVAAVAPLTLMLLPNPVPVRVTDIASRPTGAFITTNGVIYQVFPRAEQVDSFPPDAPAVGATPVVSVKSRMLDDPSKYSLYAFGGGSVGVSRTTAGANLLEMRPSRPLAPGRYFAAIARDDIFGGTDYVYFSVTATASAH